VSESDIEAGVALLATVLETIDSTPSTARSRHARIWDPAERSLVRRLAAAAPSSMDQP
jgi:hypothetical protein